VFVDGFSEGGPWVENIVLVVNTFIVDDGSTLAEDVISLGITIAVLVVFILVSIVLCVVCITREIVFGKLLFARDEKCSLDEASMPAIAGDDFVVLAITLVDVV
jgi:hypothetical protein